MREKAESSFLSADLLRYLAAPGIWK